MSEENDWKSALPEELAASPTLQDVKDVESLAKQFVDQAQHLGNSIRVPGENADADQRAAFRQKLLEKDTGLLAIPDLDDDEAMAAIYKVLGRPEKPDDYGRPEVENGVIDESQLKLMAETAHAAGISRRQFNKFVGKIMEVNGNALESATTARTEAMTKLRDEWGQAYDGKLSKAAKLAELTGAPKGLVDAIGKGEVDAGTLKWLDTLGKQLGGETAEMIQQGAGGDTGLTKHEARERADEIYATMMKLPPGDPRYNELMQKRVKYIEMASSG